MTVEERAKACAKEYVRLCYEWSSEGLRISTWDEEIKRVEEAITNIAIQALRDQIEDCAKIARRHHGECTTHCHARTAASEITVEIRALAEPTEEEKPDDDQPDDRFDLGGFECNEKQEASR